MLIKIKPLKGQGFEVEAEEGDTVQAFKAKVAALNAEFPADTQKLVFAGTVLQDHLTIQEAGMKDGDFCVVMQTKKAAATSVTAPAAALAPAAVPAPAAAPQAQAQAEGTVGGGDPEATIQMMCDMGFPRSDVERCLRAAFGNPDRAVEYLMSGIPAHLQRQASGLPPPQPTPAPAPAPGHQGGAPMANPMAGMFPPMPAANATGPLAKLQNHPIFPRLKAAVQQNPAALNQVLSAIHQGDPSMTALIAEHQEEFVRIMAEPMPVGMPGMGRAPGMGAAPGVAAGGAPPAGGAMDPVQQMLALMQQQQQQGPGAAPAPAAPQVPAAVPSAAAAPAPAAAQQPPQLTAEQEEAVGRLQALGFDRAVAVQAYVACDRNEEVAANHLFDMDDDN